MLSFAPELERLRAALGNARTDAALAIDRREVFSVQPELRIAAWGGVMLLITAAGIIIKNNLERIGPVAIAISIAIVAAVCYGFVERRRQRATLVDDYVLLLGALLISADVAFIEAQFHVFGDAWRLHLLFVAILHAATAYRFRSRVLISLAITSLASFIGAWRAGARLPEYAVAAYITAATLLLWRAIDLRFTSSGFTRTFEHFAANVALIGSLALIDVGLAVGCLATLAVAATVIFWGFRAKNEWFVLYAFLYAVLAINILLIDTFKLEAFAFFLVLLSTIGSIVMLFRIHARFKEMNA